MAARQTLAGLRRDVVRASFCDYFGLGEARSELLIALWELRGVAADWTRVRLGVDKHRPPSQGALQEGIRQLRAVMDSESIDTTPAGYSLTEIGLEECRRALAATAAVLRAIAEPA